MKKYILNKDVIPDSIKCDKCGYLHIIEDVLPIIIDPDGESVFSNPDIKDKKDTSKMSVSTRCGLCGNPLYEIEFDLKDLEGE